MMMTFIITSKISDRFLIKLNLSCLYFFNSLYKIIFALFLFSAIPVNSIFAVNPYTPQDSCDIIINKSKDTIFAKIYKHTDDYIMFKRCRNLKAPAIKLYSKNINKIILNTSGETIYYRASPPKAKNSNPGFFSSFSHVERILINIGLGILGGLFLVFGSILLYSGNKFNLKNQLLSQSFLSLLGLLFIKKKNNKYRFIFYITAVLLLILGTIAVFLLL